MSHTLGENKKNKNQQNINKAAGFLSHPALWHTSKTSSRIPSTISEAKFKHSLPSFYSHLHTRIPSTFVLHNYTECMWSSRRGHRLYLFVYSRAVPSTEPIRSLPPTACVLQHFSPELHTFHTLPFQCGLWRPRLNNSWKSIKMRFSPQKHLNLTRQHF